MDAKEEFFSLAAERPAREKVLRPFERINQQWISMN